MNADRQLAIDRIIALHLGIECPPSEGLDPSRREFTMLAWLKHNDSDLRMLGNQQACLHPIIDLLPIQ